MTFHACCGYLALQARANQPSPTPLLTGSAMREGLVHVIASIEIEKLTVVMRRYFLPSRAT
jgi:hypothetical protein